MLAVGLLEVVETFSVRIKDEEETFADDDDVVADVDKGGIEVFVVRK